MVVDDEQPDHLGTCTSPSCPGSSSIGTVACTTVPPPGRHEIVQLPPSSAARSRIDVQPAPVVAGPLSTPRPLSATVSSNRLLTTRSTWHRLAPAWRATLVIASDAIL